MIAKTKRKNECYSVACVFPELLPDASEKPVYSFKIVHDNAQKLNRNISIELSFCIGLVQLTSVLIVMFFY